MRVSEVWSFAFQGFVGLGCLGFRVLGCRSSGLVSGCVAQGYLLTLCSVEHDYDRADGYSW